MLQQTQPELIPARTEQPQTTPYRTVVHDHGRYPVITGDNFFHNGYLYPINITDKSGVRLDILSPIAAELDAMLTVNRKAQNIHEVNDMKHNFI